MSEKKTLRRNSKITGLNLKSSRQPQETLYYGNDCVTRYWVYNEEHRCIAYAHIESPYDGLAEELKQRARERKQKAIGE